MTETKVLKQLVRDHVDPNRDLGHSDKHGKKKVDEITENADQKQAQAEVSESTSKPEEVKRNTDGTSCEDCR